MNRTFVKLFMATNTFFIHMSRGWIGTKLLSQTILLLHTTGRRSGRHFITPISYFFTEGFYFLVGSNWGKARNADWYYNLVAQPRTTIEVKGRTIPVMARQAEGQEYERLWDIAVHRYPPYVHYKKKVSRTIPIVVLEPIG